MKLKLQRPLVVFDLETTGLTFGDRIVELCFLKIHPDGSEETFTTRVNPEMPIPESSTEIHGITNDDVKECPTFKEIAPKLLEMIKGCDLAGFNSAKFDLPMLDEEFARVGILSNLAEVHHIDVQNIYHKLERRTLKAAYRFYCDKDLEDAHSAEADTRATYEVLLAQLEHYPEELTGEVPSLAAFSKMQENVDLAGKIIRNEKNEAIFNFGKYKGQRVLDVFKKDPGYYGWIKQSNFSVDTKNQLARIMLLGDNLETK